MRTVGQQRPRPNNRRHKNRTLMSTLDFTRLTQPDLTGMAFEPGGTETGGVFPEPSLVPAWLGQLVVEAATRYAERKNPKHLPMQSGQARRAFLNIFGNPGDHQVLHFLQGLHRFTESDHPLAAILFRALLALSAEHEEAGDFFGPRGPDLSARPRVTVLWMRESLERWCDWVDACV